MMTRLLFVLLMLLVIAPAPAVAQDEIPTIPIPDDVIYDTLDDVSSGLADQGAPFTAPDGTPLLPDVDFSIVFGYAKWILSPAGAESLTGPFWGLFRAVGIWLGLRLILFGIYAAVYTIMYILKFVVWLIRFVLQIASTVAEIVNVITDFIGGAVGRILRFLR
jgi:hypothetical protein